RYKFADCRCSTFPCVRPQSITDIGAQLLKRVCHCLSSPALRRPCAGVTFARQRTFADVILSNVLPHRQQVLTLYSSPKNEPARPPPQLAHVDLIDEAMAKIKAELPIDLPRVQARGKAA